MLAQASFLSGCLHQRVVCLLACALRMGKRKRKHVGTVGAYLLRHKDGVWETVVHRRSKSVASGRECLATPGGSAEKADGVDYHGVLVESRAFRIGMERELREETGFCLDTIDAADVCELAPVAGLPPTHRNYCVFPRGPLLTAEPEAASAWEMMRGGVDGIGTPMPGGFHAWVSLRGLLAREDLMYDCRAVLEMLEAYLDNLFASSSASSASPLFPAHTTDSVCAPVGAVSASAASAASPRSGGGSTDSVCARVGAESIGLYRSTCAEDFVQRPLIRPVERAPLDVTPTLFGSPVSIKLSGALQMRETWSLRVGAPRPETQRSSLFASSPKVGPPQHTNLSTDKRRQQF